MSKPGGESGPRKDWETVRRPLERLTLPGGQSLSGLVGPALRAVDTNISNSFGDRGGCQCLPTTSDSPSPRFSENQGAEVLRERPVARCWSLCSRPCTGHSSELGQAALLSQSSQPGPGSGGTLP